MDVTVDCHVLDCQPNLCLNNNLENLQQASDGIAWLLTKGQWTRDLHFLDPWTSITSVVRDCSGNAHKWQSPVVKHNYRSSECQGNSAVSLPKDSRPSQYNMTNRTYYVSPSRSIRLWKRRTFTLFECSQLITCNRLVVFVNWQPQSTSLKLHAYSMFTS